MATRLSEEYVIGSKSLVPMNSPSSHTYNQQMIIIFQPLNKH